MADGRGRADLERALKSVERREAWLSRRADAPGPGGWKARLESRIPPKAADGLKAAFSRAFSLLFESGSGWIERGCRPEELAALYAVRDSAVDRRAGRAELRRMYARIALAMDISRRTIRIVYQNIVFALAVKAACLVLGALGIGLPDIVIFLGLLLRGIYSTAMNYGFSCSGAREQLFILKLMHLSLSSGGERRRLSGELDALMSDPRCPDAAELERQMSRTASAFAVDMLAIKFVQGLPLVGIVGGAANPIYYRRVTACAELKYKKRYLLGKLGRIPLPPGPDAQ